MTTSRVHFVLSAATFVLALGAVVACAAGLLVDDAGHWPWRAGAVLVGLVLAGAAVALLLGRFRRERRAIRRHLDVVGRLDPWTFNRDDVESVFPLLETRHPLHEAANRARARFLALCEQLQDFEHAQAALEVRCRRVTAERDRIRAILTALEDPVLAIDQFDELLLANPSAEALFGFDAEAVESRALAHLVRCENLIELLTTTSHREVSQSRSDEIEILRPGGESGWYRVTATKLGPEGDAAKPADSAAASGVVAVFRDIAEKKVAQRRNAEFVSSVSHEMKTPLAGIKAYVELLADGEAEDQETRDEFLHVIDSQADRLQRLVENLLNLARMEAGVVKVDKKSRPLNEVLEEAMGVVRPAAEAKRIGLLADLSPMYLGVLADRDMLLQAAINLLSNAIKYTPDGGRVTLRSRMVDGGVRFEVEDSGVGLSEEDARRVFEKFYRVKKNKDMAPGTGLGLPLAKHIIEDVHGGSISVESMLGQGSTFAVTLPGSGQLS
jgi:two-component system phosphate regulon sensor histidine kinase PhoR